MVAEKLVRKNACRTMPQENNNSFNEKDFLYSGNLWVLKRWGFKIMENSGTELKACLVYYVALGACII